MREAACWAHARRKFYDIHAATRSPLAEEALRRIQGLYAIEEEIRGKSPDTRWRVRQARASVWTRCSGGCWKPGPRYRPSRNSPVRSLRAQALGGVDPVLRRRRGRDRGQRRGTRPARAVLSRKNFLFAGADSGGERAAVLYTLLETAKLNGLDPEAYLRFVLERIAAQPSNRLAELLPWNFASQRAEHEQLAA